MLARAKLTVCDQEESAVFGFSHCSEGRQASQTCWNFCTVSVTTQSPLISQHGLVAYLFEYLLTLQLHLTICSLTSWSTALVKQLTPLN